MDCDCAPPPNEPPSISCFSLLKFFFFTLPVIPPLRSHTHIMHAYARRFSYMYRKKGCGGHRHEHAHTHTRTEKHTYIWLQGGVLASRGQ